jgi:hypothetical protein
MIGDLKLVASDEALPVKTTMESTRLLKLEEMNSWELPPFQRGKKENQKVVAFAEELRDRGGIIGGVMTLGRLRYAPEKTYLIDGQQRRGGCNLSGLEEFIADIRDMVFETMGEMAKEYIRLNSSLVTFRPDDLLKANEENNPYMRKLREVCPFIGYEQVRRASTGCTLLSMSATMRCWFGSATETPTQINTQATVLVGHLDEKEVEQLSAFLNTAHSAWGGDPEYYRLWSNLNLVMCMWLFRQLVLSHDPKRRIVKLNVDMFRKCLMSLSTSDNYIAWLLGRHMTERDRSPCYGKVRAIFSQRLAVEFNGKKVVFPKPQWAHR